MPSNIDNEREDAKLGAIHEDEEEDFVRMLSEKYGLAYTDLALMPLNMDALRVIPEAEARSAEAVAFEKNGKHLSLALVDPKNDAYLALAKRFEEGGYLLERFLVSKKSLALALARYSELSYASESRAGVLDISSTDLKEFSARLTTTAALRTFLEETIAARKTSEVTKLLEGVLAAAFAMDASDIHLESEAESIRLRFRLDGLLTDVFAFDAHIYKLMNSRIKLLSGLKLNITDRAQDGRFSVGIGETEVEIRTSIIPDNYGEAVVLRILDPKAINRSFDEMGMHHKLLARLKEEITRPNGMLLNTGPTGSGKTTTLYTFLREVHSPGVKIITIEDPVEYHIAGIVQTQVKGEEYTFASGLRSILRQDPDVIMVGEIRDKDVAETAIQASLTGHFVFSTLHTNNAAGAFPRLVDLGVDPKTFASAITVSMAQRLIRTLDPETRQKRKATDEEKKVMKRIFSTLTDSSLMPASFDEVWSAGPATAEGTGYKGRIGVHEAIFMDEELGNFLRDKPSAGDIEKATRRQGFLTMAQDGVLKALDGRTSLEEVFKVIDIPRE